MSAAADSLRAEVEAAVRDRRLATLDALGGGASGGAMTDPVFWLAAAPVWTLEAAEITWTPPVASTAEFVRRAGEAGWCKIRGSIGRDAPNDVLFWMPDELRREVVDLLWRRHDGDLTADDLRLAAYNAGRFYSLRSRYWRGRPEPADELPGALTAWIELLGGFPDRSSGVRDRMDPTAVSANLVLAAQRAVADGDLGQAQDLVAAGEAIAGMLAGSTEQALSRARRLFALGQRRRQDERALGRYLDRPELSDAVARLLDRDDPNREGHADEAGEIPWALHLRGVGGVGKTMLIRYVASGRYALNRKLAPIPVARVDFDHVSPDYPVRRPVELLLNLADELALHTAASDRADRALSAFRARAARAHEAVSGLREAGGAPLRNEEVARAVDSFGDVLAALGDVLLILDTCEELAKADMSDPATPAVRATLDIIERLHERAPSVRVLVAGRRALPERPYLTVQPVAGFTVSEARDYLAASAGRPLPADLTDAMIRQSAAIDGPVPADGELPARVSPFDLALYASWADEEPGLDVAQVARGSDAYVEGRIIERLGDPIVERALPVLAAAGRCRVTTIAEFLGVEAGPLGRRLAQHEWIDADSDPPVHVAARPALARRLRRYFESGERRAEFTARTAALSSALLARVGALPLAEVDADELLAALRLAEPTDAAALWDSIADQAMEPPGRWSTILNLTRRILGEWDEEEWATTAALRATVTAAHIAASRRDSPLFDARGPWETVRERAASHPNPHARAILLMRAGLGLIASTSPIASGDNAFMATLESAASPGSGETDLSVTMRVCVLMAALIEAAHQLHESGRTNAAGWLIEAWRYYGPPGRRLTTVPLDAWAQVARGRAFADVDEAAARDILADAERLAVPATHSEPSWPDWIPPDDLLARVRIERGLIAPPEDQSVLDAWEAYAADHLDTIDGERLASLCLRIRLRHGVVDAAVADRWEAVDRYVFDRVPSATAHHLVPPLFVSVAQAWLSAGDPERALALLDRRRREAVGTRQDDLTVRHADAATIAIVRRLRLTDYQSLLIRQAMDASGSGSSKRALQALGILGIAPGTLNLADPDGWHGWWQSTRPTALATLSGFPPQAQHWLPARTSVELADVRADLQEMLQVAWPEGEAADGIGRWVTWLTDWLQQPVPSAPSTRSADPDQELRATMRMAALTRTGSTPPPDVPRRLLAEMAFEEAELMALRLPAPAAVLFTLAASEYAKAGDVPGELMARLAVLRIVRHADISDYLPDAAAAGEMADAAFSRLRERNPALASALTGPPEDAGRWRYWAEALQGADEVPVPAPADELGGQVTVAVGPRPPSGLGSAPSGYGTAPHGIASSAPDDVALDAATPAHPADTLLSSSARGIYLRALWRITAVLAAGGAAVAGVLASIPTTRTAGPSGHPGGSSGTPPLLWIAALLAGLAVFAGLADWYIPKVRRLAAAQGIGAVRLGSLMFDVTGGFGEQLGLQARPRPQRTAPWRARAALWLIIPAVLLAARLQKQIGYYAEISSRAQPDEGKGIRWYSPRPQASTGWWRRGHGAALGIITWPPYRALGPDLVQPWERMLVASLSPEAAGRVEWIRVVDRSPNGATHSAGSELLAPSAWNRALQQRYGPPRGGNDAVGLRHVIGRAVATSAGPVMDISGDTDDPAMTIAGTGTGWLLGVSELKRGQPSVVILQAEPAGEVIGRMEPPDDQAEKLRLGAELAWDGVPAVLLLPVLPTRLATEIAWIITAHANNRQRGGAQRLLTRLRAVIAPQVPPPVLDDVVLFLSAAEYRS